jgi:hypothetical protein
MMIKIEPSGVILKDTCEIKTSKCIARETPRAVTAVWSPPGRTQINVCQPCINEMIRAGQWEIQGARIPQRADIAVLDHTGKIKLITEVQYAPNAKSHAKQAAQIRRNLLAHAGIPDTPFFLIAFPDTFYLWKQKSLNHYERPVDYYERPADYEAGATHIIKHYAQAMGEQIEHISPQQFELLIANWLQEMIATENMTIPDWVNQSGLYEAIKNGKLVATDYPLSA